jgi:hypothetical protein
MPVVCLVFNILAYYAVPVPVSIDSRSVAVPGCFILDPDPNISHPGSNI